MRDEQKYEKYVLCTDILSENIQFGYKRQKMVMQIDERKYKLWMQTLQRYDKISSVGGQIKELCDKYEKYEKTAQIDR